MILILQQRTIQLSNNISTSLGDELFSDNLPCTEEHGVLYRVEGKYITESDDVGIPSTEEDTDDTARTVINVVSAHKLQQTSFTKKQYQLKIKDYMKKLAAKLKEQNPDEADCFIKGAQAFAKVILGNFKDYDFYLGETVCYFLFLHF